MDESKRNLSKVQSLITLTISGYLAATLSSIQKLLGVHTHANVVVILMSVSALREYFIQVP